MGAANLFHRFGSDPALSPDGRMLAFLRGSDTFLGRADVYVKMLPNGDPVQLTRDKTLKLSPVVFARRLAHRLRDRGPLGHMASRRVGWRGSAMMKNASSLTWAEGGKTCSLRDQKRTAYVSGHRG